MALANLKTLLTALLLFMATMSLGGAILRLCKLKFDSFLDEAVTSLGLGIVFMIFAVFGMGVTGLLSAAGGWILLIVMLVIGVRDGLVWRLRAWWS